MEFSREEIASLFAACGRYQRLQSDKKALSDQAFLDKVRDYHTETGQQDLADALPDPSSYNRHKNGSSRSSKNELYLKALASFLEAEGFWPFDTSLEKAAEALCGFFGVSQGSRSSQRLPDLIGQYRCFQRSSWYKDYVQVSIVSFTAAPDNAKPHLLVTEQQATGPRAADQLGVVETVENFTGMAFSRENIVYLALREERHLRPKFCLIYHILPDLQERPAIHLQGLTLKGSHGPNCRLHLSRMILDRMSQTEFEAENKSDDPTQPSDERPHLISETDFAAQHPRYHKRLFEIPLTDF